MTAGENGAGLLGIWPAISGDPVVDTIILIGAAVILAALLGVLRGSRRAARQRRDRRERRRQRSFVEQQRIEQARLATQIIATSSTGAIAGFEIIRQIEAVFTDGHSTPNHAVEALKAEAARRGANALINLTGQRPPGGRCIARGDAVIVRPLADPASTAAESFQETPRDAGSDPPGEQ